MMSNSDEEETIDEEVGSMGEEESIDEPVGPVDEGTSSIDEDVGSRDQTPDADEVYCTSCREIIKKEAEVCPDCGVRQKESRTEPDQQIKDPGLAAVLSFFVAGLGQIYNGQILKGVILIVVYVFSWLSILIGIGLITTPIIWIAGMYDAYSTAQKINSGGANI